MQEKKAEYNLKKDEWLQNRFLLLILSQMLIFVLISLTVGTMMVWFWSTMSFVPPLVFVFQCSDKRMLLLSLLLLFSSQHLVYPLSQQPYGFSYGSDSINDFHVASVLYDQSHFDFGQIGYGQRSEEYSDYPMVHLFAVITAKVTNVTLFNISRFLIPLTNAILVSYCFFMIVSLIFGVNPRTAGLTTIVYSSLFYLNYKHGQFVRETFAFPFVFLSLLYFIKMQKESTINRKLGFFTLFVIFSFITFLSHHFSSYMLIVLIILLFFSELPEKRSKYKFFKEWILVILAIVVASALVILYWRSDLFMFHWNVTIKSIQTIFSSFSEGENPLHVMVMGGYSSWRTFTAIGYFVTVLFLSVMGWITVLRKENSQKKILLTFFLILFFISLVLRLYSPVHPASWGYSLAKRSTIWSFIGLSYLIVKGVSTLSPFIHLPQKTVIVLVVVWLGFSSFAPYPAVVTDETVEPTITYPRYVSCIWLKDNSIHGHQLLLPSRKYDKEYFDIALNMAPYTYLREYNLTWARFDKFSGYIPVLPGKQIDPTITLENLDTLYDNGNIKIVIK